MQKSYMRQSIAENKSRLFLNPDSRMDALDAFKLFFAVCVVAIHTHVLDGLPQALSFWVTQIVFRLAVPFFFGASGFLIGRKLYGQGQDIRPVFCRYTLRLLWPLIFVGNANAVLELARQRLRYGRSLRYLAEHFVRHTLFYPYGAMWFMQACIVGAWLLYPFLRRKKMNAALLAGALLYGWALLCNNYYFLARRIGLDEAVDSYMDFFLSARNGVFVGFFFLALGMKTWELYHAGTKGVRQCVRSSRGLRLAMLGGAVLLYVMEIAWTRNCAYLDDRALYLTHILLIPLMLLCIADSRFPVSNSTALQMRRGSIWLYFSHRFIYGFGGLLCILKSGADWRGPGAFAAVLAVSTVSFLAAEWLRRVFAR